jgi:hypothetical protein
MQMCDIKHKTFFVVSCCVSYLEEKFVLESLKVQSVIEFKEFSCF